MLSKNKMYHVLNSYDGSEFNFNRGAPPEIY